MLSKISKVLLVALGAFLLCGVAMAEEAPSESEPALDAASAAIDPVTGELRQPTREEIDQIRAQWESYLQARIGRRAAEPQVVRRADGMMSVVVGTDHLSFSIARVEADGSIVRECVENAEQAARFFQALPKLEVK